MSPLSPHQLRFLVVLNSDEATWVETPAAASLIDCVAFLCMVHARGTTPLRGLVYCPESGEIWTGSIRPAEPFDGNTAVLPPWTGWHEWHPL